jgi:hypothetical protein
LSFGPVGRGARERSFLICLKAGAIALGHIGSMETTSDGPVCSQCVAKMTLVAVEPRLGGLPELRTFCCEPCEYVFTEVVSSNLPDRVMMLDLNARSGAAH